jgi:hypothetical protein
MQLSMQTIEEAIALHLGIGSNHQWFGHPAESCISNFKLLMTGP